jgi:phage-related protein
MEWTWIILGVLALGLIAFYFFFVKPVSDVGKAITGIPSTIFNASKSAGDFVGSALKSAGDSASTFFTDAGKSVTAATSSLVASTDPAKTVQTVTQNLNFLATGAEDVGTTIFKAGESAGNAVGNAAQVVGAAVSNATGQVYQSVQSFFGGLHF